MTIRNRLKLIALVPILLLIALASYFFITSYVNYEKANTLKTILNNNAYLSTTLTEIGKERGLTSMYLGSDKKAFMDSLKKQRVSTDKTLVSMKQNISTDYTTYIPNILKVNNAFDSTLYVTMLAQLPKIKSIRQQVEKPSSDFNSIFFTGYTKTLSAPILDNLLQIKNFALDPEVSSLVSTLSQLYIAKENSALERGLIAYYMTKQASMSYEEIAQWNTFKTKANIFDNGQVSDKELQQKLQSIFAKPENKTMLSRLAKISSTIQTDMDNGAYTEETMDWFALQTQKISLLSKAELMVSNKLWQTSNNFLQKQLLLLSIAATILLLSLILAYLGYKTTKDITGNIHELENVLNKAVEEMKGSEDYISSSTIDIENIELDTHQGTKEAYKFLESLVENAKDDKHIALQANEAKSLFLANMSHEIRTPLNGIVGFTEILRNTDLTDEQDEFLAIIDKSSENLLSIINNILDLSKIESNKIEIESIVFDAEEEFESAVETYAVSASEKNIDLNYYMDPSIATKLKGDPTKIKEVIINLLSNAIKFTSNGGEINLEIIKTQSEDDLNPKILFSVQDNGIGMTKEQQSRIFEAFSQADVSVTRKYGGTGLGLTISSQFVELLGGKLELESTKDKGTKFFFSLVLEEIRTNEINYKNTFSNITLGKYTPETPSILDNYISKYFNYFGPDIKNFDSIASLKKLIDNNTCKKYWIDIDKADNNILDAIHNMDKSKLVIIANVTSRSKIEELGLSQNNVIYKPLTLSKLKDLLTTSIKDSSTPIDEIIPAHETKFNAKILVTEDNIINQKLIKRILEENGMQVDLANNGLEAFEKRRTNNYDLLFMDIQMPVMDGIEATHEILDYEEDEKVPHIPIIALTANALKGDRERFLNEGMDEYITKPIETSELIYVLNKFLSHKATMIIEKPLNEIPKEDKKANKDEEVNIHKTSVSLSQNTTDIPLEVADKNSTPEENTISFDIEPADTSLNTDIDTKDTYTVTVKEKKKILIAKKFLLERRILIKVIENLGYDYVSLDNVATLEEEIASGKYDLLFADSELITNKITQFDSVHIITSNKSKEEIKNYIIEHRG